MNDPFGRNSQSLTDALLQLDRTISLAESNVMAAQQLGLPEAAELASRLPALTIRARQFLAMVPDMSQPQRWGQARMLLDQARAFQPHFAPYLSLGDRVAALKRAQAERVAREQALAQQRAALDRAAAEASQRARREHDANYGLDEARRRFSALRQTLADMQLQRGPGYDDTPWQDALRSLNSIVAAQGVRLSAAAASVRDGDFDAAQEQLDQALGELQAGLALAQRARSGAALRAAAAESPAANGSTILMPRLGPPPPPAPSLQEAVPSLQPPPAARRDPSPHALSLIESRTGILFRCDSRGAVVGRGLDPGQAIPEVYLDLSRACDPGEAEYLGVSRRHAEIALQPGRFVVRDLGSTNGTRLRHGGQAPWETLVPQQWAALQEGDTLQFGLLECGVSIS